MARRKSTKVKAPSGTSVEPKWDDIADLTPEQIELRKGIATMHKSNMVPVFDKESAEDIAKMRRG